jgi:hypothetical protein
VGLFPVIVSSVLYRSMETSSSRFYFLVAENLFTYESYRTEVWVLVRSLQIEVEVENLYRNNKKSNNSNPFLFLEIGVKNEVYKMLTSSSSSNGIRRDILPRLISHFNPVHILHQIYLRFFLKLTSNLRMSPLIVLFPSDILAKTL